MSQRYNDNTKRPKPKENQLMILKTYVFCQKIWQRALGPGESSAGFTIYLLKIGVTIYLLKISVFIFFNETYLQKPHCVMTENISSNKM